MDSVFIMQKTLREATHGKALGATHILMLRPRSWADDGLRWLSR